MATKEPGKEPMETCTACVLGSTLTVLYTGVTPVRTGKYVADERGVRSRCAAACRHARDVVQVACTSGEGESRYGIWWSSFESSSELYTGVTPA